MSRYIQHQNTVERHSVVHIISKMTELLEKTLGLLSIEESCLWLHMALQTQKMVQKMLK